MIQTVKGFGIVNEAELDIFLELFCFFYDPADVGNLISYSSAFSKSSLNIWKLTVCRLLKPGPVYHSGISMCTYFPNYIPCYWRRRWHLTPVLLPGKSHGQRSLVGYSPWGCEELDTTEWLNNKHIYWMLYWSGFIDREQNLLWLVSGDFLQSIEEVIGEGNGTPLQYSRLENPMDRGAW